MKNKVISLYGEGKKVENGVQNYSTLLEKFILPFEKNFPSDWDMEDIYSFAINSWNKGNFQSIMPPEELKNDQSPFVTQDKLLVLANKMADYKQANFKEDDRFIASFELTEIDGKQALGVITQDEETFLAEMMDSISDEEDYEDNYIDRCAIVLKLKQPFFDWVNNLYPDDKITEEKEACIYLVDDDINDIEEWLHKKYDKLFMLELNGWHTNKKEWPQKRNFKMFNQWFEVIISNMVYDIEQYPISK